MERARDEEQGARDEEARATFSTPSHASSTPAPPGQGKLGAWLGAASDQRALPSADGSEMPNMGMSSPGFDHVLAPNSLAEEGAF